MCPGTGRCLSHRRVPGYGAPMLTRLLWDPLPDSLPVVPRRFPRLRRLAAQVATAVATARLSAQERVDRRVRRGAVQALVREAYLATVAEQDAEHRDPDAFAQVWRVRLASLLEQDEVEVTGWSEITVADLDVVVAWSLYEAARRARQQTIENASATPSRPILMGGPPAFTFTFTFEIVGATDGALGDVKYGVCPACCVGLLYNIGFAPDWQFSGLGTLALGQLEARHPGLTWYTSGQYTWSRGFYQRYRQDSTSPWTAEQHPCPHFE
jgi:hypothetical protein